MSGYDIRPGGDRRRAHDPEPGFEVRLEGDARHEGEVRAKGVAGPEGGLDGDPDADPDADPDNVARTICLQQLTRGPRSRAQLAQALARRRVPADVAERVLERFEETGLVDDNAFAEAWVQSRHSGRGLARRALAHELRQRGIAEPVLREAVEEINTERELVTARALVARRLAATRGLGPEARLRRLAGMLVRKGYPAGVAFRVVQEALGAEGEEVTVPDLDE